MTNLVLRENYPFTCYSCGYEQTAKPSLFMEMEFINTGSGTCLNCGAFLSLEITEKGHGDRMISYDFAEWIEDKRDNEFEQGADNA